MNVTAVPAFQDNYIWLMHDADNHAVIVDPGDAQPVFAALERLALTPAAILITHHHFDHTGGLGELLARYAVSAYGPATEHIAGVSAPVSEGDIVTVAGTSLRFAVLDVPGHTAGHVAYLAADALFCGDTLFAGGCGRLFEGTPQQMYDSLQKLARLPDATRVYCAHEYTQANLRFAAAVEPENPALKRRIDDVARRRLHALPTVPSTIAEEKRTNPFLRCRERAVRAAASRFAGSPLHAPEAIFTALRKEKDSW